MRVTLLGPQRHVAGARTALAQLVPEGLVTTVNAGWQEREGELHELHQVIGGRMVALELHRRWLGLLDADPVLASAQRALDERLAELRAVYGLRLEHACAAIGELQHRMPGGEVAAAATDDAVSALRALDDWHLRLAAEARQAYASVAAGRPDVQRERGEVAEAVRACRGVVVTGGHVGVLLHLLRLFGVEEELRGLDPGTPLLTWSAGAMALSERVVLFHDHAVGGESSPGPGPQPVEAYAAGLGLFPGLLPFPHPRRRLRTGDPGHLALLVRRFAPLRCVLLPEGARLDLPGGGGTTGPGQPGDLPDSARWLGPDGRVRTGADTEGARV